MHIAVTGYTLLNRILTTMKTAAEKNLTSAFVAFNHASQCLTQQYQQLEDRIAELTEQLSAANSARRRHLAEKEALAERLTGIISALPGGLLVIAANGQILQWNSKAEELLGIDLSNTDWQTIADTVLTERVLCTGDVQLNNGRRISVSIQSLVASNDRIILFSDITKAYQLQQDVQQNERLAEIGRMVADLAHQIRTPLSSAFLYLSMLRKKHSTNAASKHTIEKLQHCLSSLKTIIDDLLAYIRGQQSVTSSVPIQTLFSALYSSVAAEITQKNVQFRCIDHTENSILYANQSALEGALINLIINAAQAGATAITLSVRNTANEIAITVADNGLGIPEQQQQRIFEPFFTTRTTGTGLGLAIVKTVVDIHGGTIALDTEFTEGARFQIHLPQSKNKHLPSGRFNQTFENNQQLHIEY